jgi:hypothetical protein
MGSRKINRCAGEFACIVKVEAFMRKLFLLVSMLGLVASALAQQVTSGTMEVAFGWVKQADGTKKSIKGLKIPYTATQIQAARIGRGGKVAPAPFPGLLEPSSRALGALAPSALAKGGGAPMVANQIVYNNYNLTPPYNGYAHLPPEEFVDPSSLDDINLDPAGAGKIWTQLRFGIHSESLSPTRVILRIQIWNTAIPNPPGANDYTDVVADIGFYAIPSTGTWLYETQAAILQQAGIVVPDTDCYMSFQFRDDNDPTGEGAFELDLYNVYYIPTTPNPGSSADGWIYDSDLLDGIYEDTEFEVLETAPFSNMAFQIAVNNSSTTTTSFPTTTTVITGRSEQGNNISLWFANDLDEFQLVATIFENRQIPWAEMHVETVSPGTALLSLRLQTRTMVTRPNVTQKIELWRYGGTPGWVPFDSRLMPQNAWVDIDAVYGGTVPLSQFVGAGNKLKLRLTYFAGSNSKKFVTYQDKVNWILTR